MLKMLKHRSCSILATLLTVLLLPAAGHADADPQPSDAGRFLGRTIACDCVSAETNYALAVYHAFLTDEFGATYADQAMGHMRLALREAYDNQIIICGYVCGRDIIPFLQEVLDTAPLTYGDDIAMTIQPSAQEEGNYGQWQNCYWRPMSPGCSDLDDPADRQVAVQSDEALPPCSATEDLLAGVQCEGRQKGRVNGY
ncbi:MAG: hypothetical protein AAF563_22065 [Pseudomonadota bacterium]